jgi:hypothetical protein
MNSIRFFLVGAITLFGALPSHCTNISELPTEALTQVFSYIEGTHSQTAWSLSCKQFKDIANAPHHSPHRIYALALQGTSSDVTSGATKFWLRWNKHPDYIKAIQKTKNIHPLGLHDPPQTQPIYTWIFTHILDLQTKNGRIRLLQENGSVEQAVASRQYVGIIDDTFFHFSNYIRKLPIVMHSFILSDINKVTGRMTWPKFLPPDISRLTCIHTLNLDDGEALKLLPPQVSRLTRIKTLALRSNALPQLPRWLINLKLMSTLRIDGNLMTEIPPVTWQLPELKTLSAAYNLINDVDPRIANATKLEYIWLNNNCVDTVPHALTKLTNLDFLNLSHNKIPQFPIQESCWKKLKYFYMSHNNLTELPEEISSLTALQLLDVSFNKLTSIPESLKQTPRLKLLSLEGNPDLVLSASHMVQFNAGRDVTCLMVSNEQINDIVFVGEHIEY